jgi:hypothetical protein
MINDWKRLAWEAPNLSHSLTMMMIILIMLLLAI